MFQYHQQNSCWPILKSAFHNDRSSSLEMKELSLIRKQTLLMKEICYKIKDQKQNDDDYLLRDNNIHNVYYIAEAQQNQQDYDTIINQQQLTKFLQQIKQKCSYQCFDFIENTINEVGNYQYTQLQNLLKKQINASAQIKNKFIQTIYENQILRQQIQKLHRQIQILEQQKLKIKQKGNYNLQKQQKLLQLETVLLQKQKQQLEKQKTRKQLKIKQWQKQNKSLQPLIQNKLMKNMVKTVHKKNYSELALNFGIQIKRQDQFNNL